MLIKSFTYHYSYLIYFIYWFIQDRDEPKEEESPLILTNVFWTLLHPAGINALSCIPVTSEHSALDSPSLKNSQYDENELMLTGGEDNVVLLSRISTRARNPHSPAVSLLDVAKGVAHCAQVSGRL